MRLIVSILIFNITLGCCASMASERKSSTKYKVPIPNILGLDLIHQLATRVWLTEFNGGVAIDLAGFYEVKEICEGEIRNFQGNTEKFSIDNEVLVDDEPLSIWPYLCSPVQLSYDKVDEDTVESVDIFIKVVRFPSSDKVLAGAFNALTNNTLGKYKIDNLTIHKALDELKKTNADNLFKYFPSLEKFNWSDTADLSDALVSTYVEYIKERALQLDWPGEVHHQDEYFITFKLRAPQNFFQP